MRFLLLLLLALCSQPVYGEEYVVLLHGLARTEHSMEKMQSFLEDEGYKTCNISYPSREFDIAKLSTDFVRKEMESCISKSAKKIHFVTHSMGGIITRFLLQNEKPKNLGRVVMLSPPNGGSEVVDKLGDYAVFGWLNGPAGRELGTVSSSTPNKLGSVGFDLGVITGNRSINLVLSTLIPGDDDGKVSVDKAKVEGMRDFLVLPVSHPFIMKNDDVMTQTVFFLKKGRFKKEE